jgi:hypothetical protein
LLYKLGDEAGKDAAKEMIKYLSLKPRGGWVPVQMNGVRQTMDCDNEI